MSENTDEIMRLNKQFDKVLDALGEFAGKIPCPSNVGLDDLDCKLFWL